ncbi:MAG: hypothetical protein IKI84_13140 [Clostridia bacterium]|nr:hypothetical protein [Clostridia bacterium]
MNAMEGICGKVAPGMCRLGLNGGIAVRTSSGYRMWDMKNKRLINCDGFAVDAGEDFFFVLPTNRVRPGTSSCRAVCRCACFLPTGTR